MRIGFANIFSFRPHVEHLYYLSSLLQNAGHETYFLTCDAAVSNCYPRALKGTGKLKECSKCIMGGVRSFPVKNITSISGSFTDDLSVEFIDAIALSSSCTLNRTESDVECNDLDVVEMRKSLYRPVQMTYFSALNWIKDNSLDAVICFNGRMDLTRAVTAACDEASIPFVTHERTWFGNGLHLVPNANCLSIREMGKMVSNFDDKPLTSDQALFAGSLIGERFLQCNMLEWRLYNKNAEDISWPTKPSGRRVLVLPSSKNEFAGHDEWKCGWSDNTKALDDFFEAFSVKPEDVAIRFHPNWSENIGRVSGDRPLKLYTEWAKKRNIYFISSSEKANTYDLIQQADIVVLNGGSSAVEAGACGKQVICLGPSTYDKSKFLRVFMNRDDLYRSDALIDLDAEAVMRKTLRFVYLRAKRFPQYVKFVRAIKTTEYEYVEGADPQRLLDMIATGKLVPDDNTFSECVSEEDFVINALKEKDWSLLTRNNTSYLHDSHVKKLLIQRRFGLRWLDSFRARLEIGDR